MNFSSIIKEVDNAYQDLSVKICDKLEGNCEKCPFKEDCIAQKLANIKLYMQILKKEIKEKL